MAEQFSIIKEFRFEAAHLLDGHDGKCNNLHGHGYILLLEISQVLHQNGAKEGMVIDFGDVKTMIDTYLIQDLDHAFIYNLNNEREKTIATTLEGVHSKVYPVSFRTTAELLARNIYQKVKELGIPVVKVSLAESSGSIALYQE